MHLCKCDESFVHDNEGSCVKKMYIEAADYSHIT